MKSIHHKYLEIIKNVLDKCRDVKLIPVNAFKYEDDTVTPNRICIIDEESLPICVDVFTNNFGQPDCAKRYVPETEMKCAEWIFDDDGYSRCSKCFQKAPVVLQYQDEPTTAHTEYCPHCGSPMNN